MLTLAVVALCAVGFTLSIMAWEYRNDNANLQEHIERLERSREEMRRKIETTKKPAVESVGPVRIAEPKAPATQTPMPSKLSIIHKDTTEAHNGRKTTAKEQPRRRSYRSNEQKRKAVEVLLDDPNLSHYGSRRIARLAGVSKSLASVVIKERAARSELNGSGVLEDVFIGMTRNRKHGRTVRPRAFISDDVNQWLVGVPREALLEALDKYTANVANYIYERKDHKVFRFSITHNGRLYTTPPIRTRDDAKDFRQRLLYAVAAREDANA